MATLVEITTNKPRVQDITLKLSRSEAADLKTFIAAWYKGNYSGSYADKYRDADSIYSNVVKALEGKADASVVKVNEFI